MRGVSPDGRNTVPGTFNDLSEEEKTRAYLQFLQYHQQLEQEKETIKFQQMLNKDHRDLETRGNENNDNVGASQDGAQSIDAGDQFGGRRQAAAGKKTKS